MNILAIIISLSLEKLAHNLDEWRKFHWFINYTYWFKAKFDNLSYWNDTFGLVCIILGPVIFTGILLYELNSVFSLFGFVFSVVVLIYCLGPKDLHEVAHMFIDASEREDKETAFSYATQLLNGPVPDEKPKLIAAINRTLFISTNERLLAVFFWFLILGPIGAVFYRLSHVLAKSQVQSEEIDEDQFYESTRMLYAILNWIPVYLTCLCYGITGNFIDALTRWKQHRPKDILDPDAYDDLLLNTGLGALTIDPEDEDLGLESTRRVLQLSRHSILAYLTIIAIMTLAGWAG